MTLWNLCLQKWVFVQKEQFLLENEVVLPSQDPQGLPSMAHLGPKSYLQVSSGKLNTKWPPCEICASKNEFSSKNSNFYWKMRWFYPPPGPPRFAGHGSFGPQILPSSLLWETEEKNMTSMWNLCLKNWVFNQKWVFLLRKWGGFTPPRTPRFAGHGSFGP